MSTKATIRHGENFHFYEECFDDARVYLSLEDSYFEAYPDRVVVAIPLDVWEGIKNSFHADISYADKTNAEIRTEVEENVRARIERNAKLKKADKKFSAIFGMFQYGDVNLPEEEQIKNGIKHFTKIRKKHKELKNKIEQIKENN